MKNKRLALLAILIAFCIILSYVETFLPVFIPGVKLGLANIFILLVFYYFSFGDVILVCLLKVLITSLLRGTFFDITFFLSLGGTICSLLSLVISKFLFKKLNPIGVSCFSSYLFAIGQIIVLFFYFQFSAVIYYFPIITLFSLVTGFIIGIIIELIRSNKNLERFLLLDEKKYR